MDATISALQSAPTLKWDPGGGPTITDTYLYGIISSVDVMDTDEEATVIYRTDLDSHANMPVVGKQALILATSGETCEVSPYSPDYKPKSVPLVDAVIQYDNPIDGSVILLVLQNALHVPSMDHNLVPPFMLRQAGVTVNDTPKIQLDEPTKEDHALILPGGYLIPLSLHGVFSYFPTHLPTMTVDELDGEADIYLLTPTNWTPNSDAWATNEAAMLGWDGEMVEPKSCEHKIIIDDITETAGLVSSLHISDEENEYVSSLLPDVEPPMHGGSSFEHALSLRVEDGDFMMSIGSTTAHSGEFLFDEADGLPSEELSPAEVLDDHDWDGLEDTLDDFFASISSFAKGPTPDHLSKVWRISHEEAKRTLDNTTTNLLQPTHAALTKNYTTNDRMLRYKRISEYFFMDTFFATGKKGKSSRGHTCCQLFVTDKGFVYVVPMQRKGDVLQAMKQFAKEIGAPDAFVCDFSGEQTSQAVKRFVNNIGSSLRVLEEGTPWANKAELYIGLMKQAVRKDMKESGAPLAFWDFCLERRARIHNLTAKSNFKLHGSTSHTLTTGEDGDISNLWQFGWYDWCIFREQKAKFPMESEVLGRCLGPARGTGNEMSQWVLKGNGKIVARRSVRQLNESELHSPIIKKKQDVFDAAIEEKHGKSLTTPKSEAKSADEPSSEEIPEFNDEEEEEGPDVTLPVPDMEDDVAIDSKGHRINLQPAYDKLINAEIILAHEDQNVRAKVKGRTIGDHGRQIGTYHRNPILNSIVYDVEMPDGTVKEYAANILAENLLAQVDEEGHNRLMMDEITDVRKNRDAIPKSDGYLVTRTGQRRRRRSTRGWELLVSWKDGSETWVRLADMKESYPVDVAEFAVSRDIADEPAFAWWVPHTLKKRKAILAVVKGRMTRKTHKYGIEVPISIAHARKLDARNGNTMWMDALKKEMYNVGVAFEILEAGVRAPGGWSKATGHLIWDVKMDFTRKARWVLDGHKCADPEGSTYAGVVSRESVRIALTYAALNDMDVFAADIRNAYLQAPSSAKDYIICGPEFGLENEGKVALIHRALYGGKSAGRDFRNNLRSCMDHLGFTSCPADPDVWMRPAMKANGAKVYDYVLLYTDDVLVISDNAENILRHELGKYFELKQESIGPPKLYLGGHLREVMLENGAKAWAYSASQYVQAAVKNVEDWLAKEENKHWHMPKRAETPMQTSYRPEIDLSPELDGGEAAYYQSLIGILRWIVELGRVDICLEVSMMSSHLALPRRGHLEQLFHIFSHLKKYHNAELVFDPSVPAIDESMYEAKDWASSEFGHLEGVEETPPNMPEPRGVGFVIRAKVDADHATDTVTRKSRTGFLVWLNSSLVYFMSKKQASVETSSFGAEFCAMRQCCEYLRGLRYKLRMMGIPVLGPCYIQGDNQSVLANTTEPGSTLKKKAQSISYHYVREGVAKDEWRTTYVNTHDNYADLLTKLLPAGEKRWGFVRALLHYIYGTT